MLHRNRRSGRRAHRHKTSAIFASPAVRHSNRESWQCFQHDDSGNSTLELTPIGLGAWAIGGEWRFGWGPQDDADSIATIRRAVERGLNWIDTAAIYGLGHSEEVVGRALRDIPRSERPYVFTKCSLVWDDAGQRVAQPRARNRFAEKSSRACAACRPSGSICIRFTGRCGRRARPDTIPDRSKRPGRR